jgi:acetyl-CoA acetyltransferase
MARKVFVIGVGMTKFEKPGSKAWDYPDMAKEAGTKALEDAGIGFDKIERAAVGYCYGDSTCGPARRVQPRHPGYPQSPSDNSRAGGVIPTFFRSAPRAA